MAIAISPANRASAPDASKPVSARAIDVERTAQPIFIKWFEEIHIEDIPQVGGKTASLGEMYRELAPKGIRVPNGYAITAEAYRYFLREAGLDQRIRSLLSDLDTRDIENLRQRGSEIRHLILSATLPKDLEDEILVAYDT
ncbi:MAG: PEP/pyruvate-binding domain-containing protein, partial [Limisphaerales bacterium]